MKFIPKSPALVPSFGLLALRIVAGTAMALHGWPKIQNMTTWMGPDATVPSYLQAAAAIAEFGGGICWVIGLLTPIASLMILATMVVAVTTVHLKAGHDFVSTAGQPSWELGGIYASIALCLLLIGPGMHSVDQVLFNKKCEEA